MEQTLKKVVSQPEQLTGRSVDLFINSHLVSITGDWEWDMHTDTIFCTDVIISLPPDYIGTKGIIHPDDLAYVREKLLSFPSPEPIDIEFRMITTYSEVKKLTGKNCYQAEVNELKVRDPKKDYYERAAKQKELEKGNDAYYNLKGVSDQAEIITKTGKWYSNTHTNETYYSDNIFRIHALTPQSLNSHLNTFTSFIHSDDSAAVNEAFDKAYKDQVPVILEYRIITANGAQKFISQTTHWSHNHKGELIVNGFIQDLTASRTTEYKIEQAENDLHFHKELLEFNETVSNIAYWSINLLTRQTYYSDNYYRIHGVKPQSIPASASIFNNYIHRDDREKVIEALKNIRKEHTPPDIEYCIIRADGKLRHVVQKGKLLSEGGELIMAGILRDVTAEKTAEQKLREQHEINLMKDIGYAETEHAGGIASWVHDLETGNSFWSDNIYNLLGYKKNVKDLSYKELLKSVLPEQRKKVSDEIAFVMEGQGERQVEFSILRVGEVRNVKGIFKLVNAEGNKFFTATVQDITSHELLEQQLFEGLQINQLLAQNILDSVFITDINNRIILWNRKCEQLFNLKQDEVLNRNYFDVFPQNKTENILSRFSKVLKGDLVNERYERINEKGIHNLNMMPLRDKENRVIGILHVMHDVTNELQLHNNLTERLNFIEKLLEETVDRIAVLDKNLNYIYWNKKAEQHFRINQEYVTGKNLLEIFPSIIKKPIYQQFKRALKGETVYVGTTEDSEWEGVREGEEEYSETYLIPLLNTRNEVTSVLWIVHDLTKEVLLQQQHKDAEKEVRQTKELLQSVFDASLHGIILFKAVRDTKGKIKDYEVVLNNSITQKWNGRDLTGKMYAAEFPQVKEQGIFNAYKEVLETGKPMQMEVQYEAEGFKKWFTVSAVKLNENELVATAQDITERKKAQEQLLLHQEKILQHEITHKADEKLLKKKDEFISIASHELKTPVTNIKMSLHILSELIAGTEEKKLLESYIKKTDKQANKLATLIDELLDVTLIQENKLQVRKSNFNVKEAIEESVEELGAAAKDVTINIEGDKEINLSADKSRIQQVLTNFLINAIKYSPGDKDVKVKIEKLDDAVKVSVTDKGIGIPEDKQSQVFDRYYRVDDSSKQISGLGLGLYISKQIIKKHGGEAGVHSTPSKGSTFWFTIPVK